jgi:hypothetical protein
VKASINTARKPDNAVSLCMGESKLSKPTNWLTVYVVATDWTRGAHCVGLATAVYKLATADIDSVSNHNSHSASSDLILALAEGIRESKHVTHPETFALVLSMYVGRTESYAGARLQKAEGLWLKLMTNANGNLARTHLGLLGPNDQLGELMHRIQTDANQLSEAERRTFVYDHRQTHITGPLDEVILAVAREPQLATAGDVEGFGTGKSHTMARDWFKNMKFPN